MDQLYQLCFQKKNTTVWKLLRLRCQSCACEQLGVFAQMPHIAATAMTGWIWMTYGCLWEESKWINYCTSTIQYLKLKTVATVEIIGTIWNTLEQFGTADNGSRWFKRSDLEASVVDVVRMFWSVLAVSADPKNRLCRHYTSSSVESKLSPMSYDSYDVWTSLKHLPGNYRMDVRPLALPADGFGAALASLFSWMQLNYIQSYSTIILSASICDTHFFSDNFHI